MGQLPVEIPESGPIAPAVVRSPMTERCPNYVPVFLGTRKGHKMRRSPNDRKLSDTPERRGTCMVGGKAVVEAGAVTRRRVRCSAWLGDVGGGMYSIAVLGKHRCNSALVPPKGPTS